MEDTGGKSGRRPGRHLQVELLAREMPDLHTGGLWVDSGAARSRKGARAGQRGDRRGSYGSARPGWTIQEVSRVGAQGVTSKSKLLAQEMPDLHTAHWRLVGRFRRGEVVEGCAGGAEGRSKRLICLRRTWMEDTGGKSGRRPGRHLQVEASGPGNARPAHWRLAGRFRRGKVTEGCAGGAAGRSKGLICLRVT